MGKCAAISRLLSYTAFESRVAYEMPRKLTGVLFGFHISGSAMCSFTFHFPIPLPATSSRKVGKSGKWASPNMSPNKKMNSERGKGRGTISSIIENEYKHSIVWPKSRAQSQRNFRALSQERAQSPALATDTGEWWKSISWDGLWWKKSWRGRWSEENLKPTISCASFFSPLVVGVFSTTCSIRTVTSE